MRDEELAKIVFIHRLGEVRNVEVGVKLIGEGLQLRIERLLETLSA